MMRVELEASCWETVGIGFGSTSGDVESTGAEQQSNWSWPLTIGVVVSTDNQSGSSPVGEPGIAVDGSCTVAAVVAVGTLAQAVASA